jgi:uncharacterized protein YecE (DUF72 family)
MTKRQGNIYAGIGGWSYEPWRGAFYPKGLPHARELAYAAEHLTAIEINGTFYRTQSPATYRKWASEVPDKFIFSLKGPRYAVNRRVLSEAGDSIKRSKNSTKPISAAFLNCCPRLSTDTPCATWSRCATTVSKRRPS